MELLSRSIFFKIFILGLFCLLQCGTDVSAVSVMSIDFGSEWMKIAIVSPGVPMEIALNKESKRKTPIAVAFRDGERTFGEDAMVVGVRFPKNCYLYLVDLLGKTVDNPMVQLYRKRFPYYDIVPDPVRKTVRFRHDDKNEFSVEELVAMLLHHAKGIAEMSANQPISDAVITVPGYFNQAERRAMLQAANLAGINVLQLINDYTAVALNYGIFRRKDFNDTAQYIVLYDMGASSTTATIISYQNVKTKEKGFVEVNPQLSVLGVGFDRTLGGLDIQLRLQHHLATKFNELKKTSSDVFKNPRSMAKLFKEAGRLKTILSANADHFAQVEGLIDDVDMRIQVTRAELEEMSADLMGRVTDVLDRALKASSLTLDVISQVILVGAGTRVPWVQERLSKQVGAELGKSLNTDEAAVLGAAYKAADLSKGFKVKKFITKDAVVLPIHVTFEREGDSGSTKQVKRTLFGPMNPYPQKKIMTFNKHTTDFDFLVSYGDLDYLNKNEIEAVGNTQLFKVRLVGVAEAIAKHQGESVDPKGIKAHFSVDDSGILVLLSAEYLAEKTVSPDAAADAESTLSKLGSTITNFFSSSSDEANVTQPDGNVSDDSKENKSSKGGADTVPGTGAGTPETNATKEGKPKEEAKPKIVTIREEISLTQQDSSVPTMVDQQLSLSVKKLEELNTHDEAKARREGALNALESLLFDVKIKLEGDDHKAAATPNEVSTILQLCTKLSEWLEEEGWGEETTTIEGKLGELRRAIEPVWMRVAEHKERPEALAALTHTLNSSTKFLVTVKNSTEHGPDSDDPLYSKMEIDLLGRVINEVMEWKKKAVLEQEQTPLFETPKLTVKMIMEKIASLDREVKYLLNKAKFWKPKPKEPSPGDKKAESENKTETNKAGEEKVVKDGGEPKKKDSKVEDGLPSEAAEKSKANTTEETPDIKGMSDDVHVEL